MLPRRDCCPERDRGLPVLPHHHWRKAGVGAGGRRGVLARRTGAKSARVSIRASASADTREHSHGALLDIVTAVEDFTIPGERASCGQTEGQYWLNVAELRSTLKNGIENLGSAALVRF